MKIIKYSLLLGLLCITFFAQAHSAGYSLDAHVHFDAYQTNTTGQMQFLTSNKFKRAFLISRSYTISKLNQNSGEDAWKSDESQVFRADKDVSDFISKYPDRFVGVCGVNLKWTNAYSYVDKCLSLPNMRGLKLRTDTDRTDAVQISNSEYFTRIGSLLTKIKNRNTFVLWHFDAEGSEIDLAFELTKKYRNITFIFAHSMYSTEAIEHWRRLEGAEKLQNVYLEISTFYANVAKTLNTGSAKAWKNFGIERILFGSDLSFNFLNSQGEHGLFVNIILESEELSNQEKNMILNDNGELLLDKLDIPK
jgi:predicted TIM-barrel fold metal-dependent hydrolase